MENQIIRNIMRHIATISRCLIYIREVQFKKYDLNRGQHAFLTRIVENPGISQEELSYLLKVDKTTTAKALKKLQNKEFVIRKRSEVDKRKWELYPTSKLLSIYPELESKILKTAKSGLKSFSDEEAKILLSLLEKLEKNINIEWQNVKKEDK